MAKKLSLMGQLRKEADRDFSKYLKYVNEIFEENEKLEEENKRLKEENEYRKSIADVLPEGKGHIAEETIQDLQARIKELEAELDKYKKQYEHSMGFSDFGGYDEDNFNP